MTRHGFPPRPHPIQPKPTQPNPQRAPAAATAATHPTPPCSHGFVSSRRPADAGARLQPPRGRAPADDDDASGGGGVSAQGGTSAPRGWGGGRVSTCRPVVVCRSARAGCDPALWNSLCVGAVPILHRCRGMRVPRRQRFSAEGNPGAGVRLAGCRQCCLCRRSSCICRVSRGRTCRCRSVGVWCRARRPRLSAPGFARVAPPFRCRPSWWRCWRRALAGETARLS